ncbi:hypothetical protein HN51_041941 [Arachis hypogaea]
MVDRYIVPKDNFIFMKLLSGQCKCGDLDATRDVLKGMIRLSIGKMERKTRSSDCILIGMEAAGFGLDSDKHIATLTKGEVGVLHGALSYLLQDDDGQNVEPHSINYLSVGPEYSFLKDIRHAEYYSNTDEEAL